MTDAELNVVLLKALKDAAGCMWDELNACGPDDIDDHPTLAAHSKVHDDALAAIALADGRFVAHIRNPISKRGGNSKFRDTHERQTSTFCGAPVTSGDWDYPAAMARKNAKLAAAQCCPTCFSKAKAIKGVPR